MESSSVPESQAPRVITVRFLGPGETQPYKEVKQEFDEVLLAADDPDNVEIQVKFPNLKESLKGKATIKGNSQWNRSVTISRELTDESQATGRIFSIEYHVSYNRVKNEISIEKSGRSLFRMSTRNFSITTKGSLQP